MMATVKRPLPYLSGIFRPAFLVSRASFTVIFFDYSVIYNYNQLNIYNLLTYLYFVYLLIEFDRDLPS